VELKTFHCERVRKMPLSGLDPSMLTIADATSPLQKRLTDIPLWLVHKSSITAQLQMTNTLSSLAYRETRPILLRSKSRRCATVQQGSGY